MKILVVGSGGREHALCWRFHQEGHTVVAVPGNPGIRQVADCEEIDIGDICGIVGCAQERNVELVVVGPEGPLLSGLADRLRAEGILVFGPSAAAAQLEGSKVFAKQFFARHGIRSAQFFECRDMDGAKQAVEHLGDQVVVKADGLAAGKGVVVCENKAQALEAAHSMLVDGRFGTAGERVLIEQRLEGRELSVMAICDGARYELLAQAEDHKAVADGDAGPNTGGMGTVSPALWCNDELLQRVRTEIFDPTIQGLQEEKLEFKGVLYAGLMVSSDGVPWLLEYNVRFGDPETQSVLRRLQSNLGEWLSGAAKGNLPSGGLLWDSRAAVCVILAARDYPESSTNGQVISGLPDADAAGGIVVFHAGTALDGDAVVTAGGRILGVTALGESVASARSTAYNAVTRINFSGMKYRRDIGARGE